MCVGSVCFMCVSFGCWSGILLGPSASYSEGGCLRLRTGVWDMWRRDPPTLVHCICALWWVAGADFVGLLLLCCGICVWLADTVPRSVRDHRGRRLPAVSEITAGLCFCRFVASLSACVACTDVLLTLTALGLCLARAGARFVFDVLVLSFWVFA